VKKITALVLVLGVAVSVNAWHLFPVREKIITIKETNYTACAVTGVVVGLLTLTAGLLYGKFFFKSAKPILEVKTSVDFDVHPIEPVPVPVLQVERDIVFSVLPVIKPDPVLQVDSCTIFSVPPPPAERVNLNQVRDRFRTLERMPDLIRSMASELAQSSARIPPAPELEEPASLSMEEDVFQEEEAEEEEEWIE
jgi:hypothetical protein